MPINWGRLGSFFTQGKREREKAEPWRREEKRRESEEPWRRERERERKESTAPPLSPLSIPVRTSDHNLSSKITI